MSIGRAVDEIFAHIDQQGPRAASIKKLLFLKLETELNSSRCVIEDTPPQPSEPADAVKEE